LEKHDDGNWWVFKTGEDGRLMAGFPKLRTEPFRSLSEAQAWVEALDPREPS